MTEPISTVAALAKGLAPAFLGSVLSSLTNRNRSVIEHFVAILAGMSISYYGVGAATEYWQWTPGFRVDGAKFVTGLFALQIVYAVSENIRPAIDGLRAKFAGGSK
jgi:hypothetical protein